MPEVQRQKEIEIKAMQQKEAAYHHLVLWYCRNSVMQITQSAMLSDSFQKHKGVRHFFFLEKFVSKTDLENRAENS